jgi:hypothetical protein
MSKKSIVAALLIGQKETQKIQKRGGEVLFNCRHAGIPRLPTAWLPPSSTLLSFIISNEARHERRERKKERWK